MDQRRPRHHRPPNGSTRERIDGRPQPRRRADPTRQAAVQNRPLTHANPRQATGRQRRPSHSQRARQAPPRASRQRETYVGNRPMGAPRRNRSKLPFVIGGFLALAVVVGIGWNAVSALTAPTPTEQTEDLAVADQAPQPQTLTISFAGDCTLGTDSSFDQSTSFNARYDSVDDLSWFFANVVDLFNADDLTVVNMEGTLTDSTERADKTFAFKGPDDYAQVLIKGGVETCSLANNHSRDYGEQSYTDTISALEAAGLGTFGYDRIDYREVNGVKVALIGTYELAEGIGIKDELEQNIKTAKEQGAALTIVYFHWGNEKETVPDETQVQLGHAAVDAGADLVIGSHPHVIQGYEKYQGRYIVYSLGNFCFGGNANPSDTDCMIFQQTFTVTGSDVATDDAIEVIPCSITSSSSGNNYQPTPAEGSEKTRIEGKIEESNESIAVLSKNLQANSQSESEA